MWISNDYLIMRLARQRELEILKQARIAGLLAQERGERPGTLRRSLTGAGEMLIRIGNWLKEADKSRQSARHALQVSGVERGAGD